MSIEEPFHLHCWVVDGGERGLHMDGLAFQQALLVSQGASKVGFLNHGYILGALAWCLLLQAADLGHGLGVLRLHNEVTLGWREERDGSLFNFPLLVFPNLRNN